MDEVHGLDAWYDSQLNQHLAHEEEMDRLHEQELQDEADEEAERQAEEDAEAEDAFWDDVRSERGL